MLVIPSMFDLGHTLNDIPVPPIPKSWYWMPTVELFQVLNSGFLALMILTQVGDRFSNGFEDIDIIEIAIGGLFLGAYAANVYLIGYDLTTAEAMHDINAYYSIMKQRWIDLSYWIKSTDKRYLTDSMELKE